MPDIEREIHSELIAIHSRLGTIDGKVTLLARSRRDQIREELAELVDKKPLVAQIYLVLDGKRTQRDVVAELAAYGIDVHEATVSRHITREMLSERGLVDLVDLVDVGVSKITTRTAR
jgi:intracellular sulfur oxidation DsrE/DsrF family protein